MTRSTEISIEIECELSKEHFGEWDSLSPELQSFWNVQKGGTRCDGSGEMSTWCDGCQFCKLFDVERS